MTILSPLSRVGRILRLGSFVGLFLVTMVVGITAETACRPVADDRDYEHRFGRAASARTASDLESLFENPISLHAGAKRVDGPDGATVDVMTETHVVYPVRVADLTAVFSEDAPLTEYTPNLASHEVVCHPSDNVSRHRQRTDFGAIAFNLGTEYIVDVQYVRRGREIHANRWVLVESVDGRLAYNYGSWYFESVDINGKEATYIRHYARTGLTTRVPGVRFFAGRRAAGGVIDVIEAAYKETVRRFDRTEARAAGGG